MKRQVGLFDGAVNSFWVLMVIAWARLDLRMGIPEQSWPPLLAGLAYTLVIFCCFAAILESQCHNWRLFAWLAALILVVWFVINLLFIP